MRKTLLETVKPLKGLIKAAQAAGTVNGAVIDRDGFRDAVVHLGVGAASGAPTATKVTLKIQHGDAADGSDAVDAVIANVTTVSGEVGANGETYLNLDLLGFKRYIRPVAVVAFTGGTSPAVDVAATVVLGNAEHNPATRE